MLRALLFYFLYLIPLSVTAQSTSLEREWHQLDSLYWVSANLESVVGPTKKFILQAGQADSLLAYFPRLKAFGRSWYEYGFSKESRWFFRTLLWELDLQGQLGGREQSALNFELCRSSYFASQPDSLRYWAEVVRSLPGARAEDVIEATNLLGNARYAEQDYVRAANRYREVIELARVDKDFALARQADFHDNLLLAYLNDRAYAVADSAANAVSKDSDFINNNLAFRILALYAARLDERDQFHRSGHWYVAAETAYLAMDGMATEAYGDFNFNRGVNASYHGELDDALTYFARAQIIYDQISLKDFRRRSFLHRSRGNAFFRQREYRKAISEHQASQAINTSTGDSLHLALDFTNLGVNYAALQDQEKALHNYRLALAYRRGFPDVETDVSNDYINLADVYLALHHPDSARVYADSALQIEEPLLAPRQPQLAYTYLTQARIRQAEGDLEEALDWANRSLAANHNDFLPVAATDLPKITGHLKYNYFFEAILLKGQLFAERGDADDVSLARTHYHRAADLLDAVRRELTSREDKITLAGYAARLSEAAIANAYVQWQQGKSTQWAEEAFQFAERSKAGILHGALAGQEARDKAGIPDALLQEEDELTAAIGFHKRQLASGPDSTERVFHQRELFAATQQYKILQERYAADYPRYFELRYAAKIPSLTEVQGVLTEHEVLRSYFTGADSLYVFTLTNGSFDLRSVALPNRLSRDVSGMVRGITRRLDRAYLRKGRSLYQLLFPGPKLPNGGRLILLPDGPLQRIPFEALLTEEVVTGEVDFAALPYLLRRHTVSYAVSATLLHKSRLAPASAPENAGPDLVAFAPVFGSGGEVAGAVRNLGQGTLLSALPATEVELKALAKVFRERDRTAITYLGPEATESALQHGQLNQARFLHFATHGFVNEEHPDLSGLALYPDSTGTDDDFLSVGEVYNLRLAAELVTLSACETGLGKVASGEGVLGFSRAFFHAGAANLLVSLWQVQDEATAALMVDFYRRALDDAETSFTAPLHAAKLKLLREQRTCHPFYWSGFVLVGK